MASSSPIDDFKVVLSLDPLLDFWRDKVAPECQYLAEMFAAFEKQIKDTPELRGDISQPDLAPGTRRSWPH